MQLVLVGLRKTFIKEERKRRGCCGGCSCCKVKRLVNAVDGVNLTMRSGETFALLGHNGAGKTTTINIITAQLKPSGGDALVCGTSVNLDAATARKAFGCCPQHDVLYPERACARARTARR